MVLALVNTVSELGRLGLRIMEETTDDEDKKDLYRTLRKVSDIVNSINIDPDTGSITRRGGLYE